MFYFRGRQHEVDPLCELERAIAVYHVRPGFVRFWFGRLKGFPRVEEVVKIITNEARVDVAREGDLSAAIAYGNHNSTQAHHNLNVGKIFDDVRLGRAFASPRSMACAIPGLRLSPMGIVVSPSKRRIIHDLSFRFSPQASSVNADTVPESAPPVEIGRVLRDIICRVLFLRQKFGTGVDIVLSKVDMTDAFRKVRVQGARSAVFGYSCEGFVIIYRCLEFGWINSPEELCLLTSALEYAHLQTSAGDATVIDGGWKATQHIDVIDPPVSSPPPSFPPGCRTPPGAGGGKADRFFIRLYVDDGNLVEIRWFRNGKRCKQASGSCAADYFRLFGPRRPSDPPLLSPNKLSHWQTKLIVLGWEIDTQAMTVSVPAAKLLALRETLAQWPAERQVATEKELRGLTGKLLICICQRLPDLVAT